MKELNYIQNSLSPVILISAYALLLLSMTNRYSHLTTRFRNETNTEHLDLYYNRILIMKYGILCMIASIISIDFLIIILFFLSIFGIQNGLCLIYIFCISIFLVMGGMSCYVLDVFLSVKNITKTYHMKKSSSFGRVPVFSSTDNLIT